MQLNAGIKDTPAIQLLLDAANVNTAGTATGYLQNILMGNASQQSLFETRMLFNPQMKSAYNFVPGIMGLIFILVCAMMTSVSIVREKEVGTMEVLLVSPVRPVKIIFAKMIPYFVISCIVLGSILVLAHYLLDVPMSGGIGGIIAISMLYLLLALSLGLLVSNIAKTQVAALLISAMVMMMPMLLLSGMMFPIENLPKFFQVVSNIIPARWYIDAIRKMMIQGLPLLDVWQDIVILMSMTVALLGISLKKFNDKLE
jgi:ABC-2 type transport system permease protein